MAVGLEYPGEPLELRCFVRHGLRCLRPLELLSAIGTTFSNNNLTLESHEKMERLEIEQRLRVTEVEPRRY